MGAPLRVLIVEDSEDDTLLLVRQLRRDGFDPVFERVETAEAMQAALRRKWDIVISDYSLPHFDPLRALKIVRDNGLDIPFIVVSGSVGETTILAAMKAGASDYLMKENLTRLASAVQRELREAAGRRERRRLEEQLRHAQKMEAVGRLAGGVAHDFNNLLTVITGYSEILLSRGQLPDTDRLGVEEIRKAAERGSALTRQLLAFSRRQAMAAKIVRPNELIGNMEKMLQRLIGEDVELVTDIRPDLGVVWTDPGQLEQVIMNLVVNARDAMPQGGRMIIESSNVELQKSDPVAQIDVPPGPYVVLTITDTGCGMDEETRSHLFEPFFTTKEPGKGTGLGLATAYGIVRQSGGTISVWSEPGQGTTVRIYLPRVEQPKRHEENLPEPPKSGSLDGSETILLVEDESRVRKLIAEILSSKGYRVLESNCGEDAFRLSQSSNSTIHLVVTDVIMPEMSGPEVVRRLSALRPGLRALYISGYTDEAMAQHGILESGVPFLQKPFLPNALLRKVREVLDSKRV